MIKSSRALVSHDQCGIDSTSDVQNKSNTTISDMNKRARGIEDNDSRRQKAKTVRHEGPRDMINTPSMSTLKSRPAHPIVNPASDQYSDNDNARTITSDAPIHTDNNTA